jgi:hypothetical protein
MVNINAPMEILKAFALCVVAGMATMGILVAAASEADTKAPSKSND